MTWVAGDVLREAPGAAVLAAGPPERGAQAIENRRTRARLNFFTGDIMPSPAHEEGLRISYDRRGGFMRRITAVMFGWLLMLGAAAADEHRGVIVGQLIGADSAPVGAVTVRVEREGTGETRRTTATRDGRFIVAALDPGSYRISVDDARFSSVVARAEVRAAETTHLELQAGLGSSGNVDFRPYFQNIDRVSPGFRTRFEDPFITALPLDRRDLTHLAALTPGLTASATSLAAGGTLSTSTAYLVDGVAAFDPVFGTPVLSPLPESTIELTVFTPPLDARMGRSAGAQASVVTRSGSNVFSGAALAFYQTDAERLQVAGLAGGPIARNRSFFFADASHDREDDSADDTSGFTRATGRIDMISGAGRLTARYGLGRGGRLDRSADLLGITYAHQLSPHLVNDARAGFARLSFDDRWSGVLPEFDSLEAANVLTWSGGSHLVRGGVEYYGVAPVEALLLGDETTVAAFVQDQWRASSRLSLTGGVRFERVSRDEDGGDEDDSLVSPRGGFVLALGDHARQVVRGDYGRHLQASGAALDGWTVGLQRQWGRMRTLEVGYIGARTNDDFTGFGSDARYDALRIQLQQRSETAVSTQVGYTYGRWTIASASEDERVRASLDSRHKLTAAFAWHLPLGPDGLWFTDGWAEGVFGGLQLSGIAALQTGRPRIDRNAPQGPSWRTVDLALIKTLMAGGRRLEIRAEMFNLTDRANPRPGILGTGFEELFADDRRGRRLQFGGRYFF